MAAHRASFRRVTTRYGRPDADQRLQVDVADGVHPPATTLARYLQVRTLFFDRLVVEAIDRGVRQMTLVGAGYDGRSIRYARPGVRWFELDHPDTQRDKRARLERLHIASPDVVFVEADFSVDDAAEALARAGHDSTQPTFFACEGVGGYLRSDVLAALLASLRRCAAPESTLAITLSFEPDSPSGRITRARLDAAVSALGEPLRSAVPRSELGAFLSAAGWRVARAIDPSGVDVTASERSSAFVVALASKGRRMRCGG